MSGFGFSGWLYQSNSAANLISFVPCRFGGLAWIIYGMTRWNERVSQVYLYLLVAAVFVLWVTNMILYWRLISSDLLRRQRQASPAATADAVATLQVASTSMSVHCNGVAAVSGSLLGHVVIDRIQQQHEQKGCIANGPSTSLIMRQRCISIANDSL